MIDTEDLQLVATIAETGSARRTASALRIHLATVYRRLGELERSLGQPLFDRADGTFAPTPTGFELVSAWGAIAGRLGELDRRLAGHDGRLQGELAVTTTDSLLPVLAGAMPDFQAAHPSITIRLSVSNANADMGRREADVAVRPTSAPPESLIGRRIAGFRYAVYVVADAAHWIALDESLAGIPAAIWLRERTGAAPAVVVNSMWAAAEACAAGLGRAVLPTYIAKMIDLRRIGEPLDELQSAVWLLYHPDQRRSPRVRLFSELVVPTLARRLAGG